MTNVDRAREKYRRANRRQRTRAGLIKTVVVTLVTGIVVGWISIPFVGWVDGGEWPDRVSNMPFAFFALGCVWGFALTRVADVREATRYLLIPFLLGALFWFNSLWLGALVILFGASEHTANKLPTLAFTSGALLGCVPLAARLTDTLARLRDRIRGRARA